MIVIAIIGILAAIAIPNFLSYQKKGYDVAAQSDAMNFLHAAMNHFAAEGTASKIILNQTDTPNGYATNDDFEYDGALTQNTVGKVSGTMTFKHTKSAQKYILDGSTGSVKKLP
jgi:type II secretory pathway pseudopilin PulG